MIEQYATRIRFRDDGTSRRELRVRARVLSDEGARQLSHLAFEYDRQTEKLEITDVAIHQANGGTIGVLGHAVVDRPVAAAKDAPEYADAREKAVHIPGLKATDLLEYTVSLAVVKSPAPGHFWLEHNFLPEGAVKQQVLEVAVPRDRPIKIKTRQGSKSFTTSDEQDGGTSLRIYSWKPAPGGPSVRRAADDEPDVQLSTFLTWEDVGDWLQTQWNEPSGQNSEVNAKVSDITQGRNTGNEKLAALYTFVSQKIRTIELAPNALGYRFLPAAKVLTQGYGTPLDKHVLLAAMAKRIGLRATLVLVSGSRQITDSVPSPAQFNHLVTAVKIGEEWTWLDTAPEVAPFGMLAANLRDKRGLALLEPDDNASQTKPRIQWRTTAANPPFPATQSVTVTAEVSIEGKMTARVRYAIRGDTELLLRVAFHRAPQSQWKNLGQLLAISDGFRGEVANVVASNPEDTEKPFEVEYRITQNKVVSWKNQNAGLPLPLPSFGLPELPTKPDAAKSKESPLELGTPLNVKVMATVSVPRSVTIQRTPFAVAVKRDYAEYRSTYKAEPNKVTATRELRFLLREISPERISDYAAFAQTVRNDEAQQVGLERSTPAQNPQSKTGDTRAKGMSTQRVPPTR